ncbi:MAG: leucine-rich repeat domain-containing protein, partial [Ruminococcus flavefaciens]|nr:leucine-rich repeat domain-containing protein [Ruminococcus flavefaciens]
MVLIQQGSTVFGYEKASPYAERNSLFLQRVTTIMDSAFAGFSALGSAFFTNDLKIIGRFAFASCTSLEKINIPDSVAEIGTGAFDGCKGLKEVTVPEHLDITKVFTNCSPDLKIYVRKANGEVYEKSAVEALHVEEIKKDDCIPGAKVPETDYRQLFL